MIDFLIEYWQLLLGTIASGGLSSIFTMRIGVKSAKIDLTSKMQEVYGKMIDDLQKQINTIRELGCLDKECEKRKRI